jgi:hypothetical protein
MGVIIAGVVGSLLTLWGSTHGSNKVQIEFVDAGSGRRITNAVIALTKWSPYPLLHQFPRLPKPMLGRYRNVNFPLTDGQLSLSAETLQEGTLRFEFSSETYPHASYAIINASAVRGEPLDSVKHCIFVETKRPRGSVTVPVGPNDHPSLTYPNGGSEGL